jgi:hypothetical protein
MELDTKAIIALLIYITVLQTPDTIQQAKVFDLSGQYISVLLFCELLRVIKIIWSLIGTSRTEMSIRVKVLKLMR